MKCWCQNGAACDPVRGTCTCPPGFIGDTCEHGKIDGPQVSWEEVPPGASPTSSLRDPGGHFCFSPALHTPGAHPVRAERGLATEASTSASSPQSAPSAGMGQAARGLASVSTSVPVTPRLATAAWPRLQPLTASSPKVWLLPVPWGQEGAHPSSPSMSAFLWCLAVKQCLLSSETTLRTGEVSLLTG